jgi:Protein of unknown function (DUF4058)
MPMHDWTRVEAGIYHDFHHSWVSEVARSLNRALPASSHYAMIEPEARSYPSGSIAVRHVSGDRVVAIVEIVSPGNKSSKNGFTAFVQKACELLEHRVHLLFVDPFPPGPRDPNGVHGAIWDAVEDDSFRVPPARPLTLVAYECGPMTRAYIETIAVGEPLPDMPLFLEPEAHILVPLEATYRSAWDTVPARWQRVIAPPA